VLRCMHSRAVQVSLLAAGAIGGAAGDALHRVGLAEAAPRAGGAGPTAPPRAEEITFTSGADTLYGTLLLPGSAGPGSRRVPGALILAGSGPTDRDGNSAALPGEMNTYLHFAEALAGVGVASLRYDKLASGKTGLASYAADPAAIGFQLFVDEARAAYALLAARSEVDLQRLLVVGHSEGGLIALVLATDLLMTGATGTAGAARSLPPARALVLASPLGSPYLVTIRRQLTEQYTAAQAAGLIAAAEVSAALAELDAVVNRLISAGQLPEQIATPALRAIFTPTNARFLAEVAPYDPAALAAALPSSLATLIMRGEKDQQVSHDDVLYLYSGFTAARNDRAALVELPDVNHVFKEVAGTPNPVTDYVNPDLPFSHAAVERLTAFLRTAL
jgi:alpha-beta hydrolase superfamily lysophospholipase